MSYRNWMWACALLLAMAPALAHTAVPNETPAAKAAPAPEKTIIVDWGAGLVYPLENWDLVHTPFITNNRKDFTERDLGTFAISEKVEDKRSNLYNIHGKPILPGEEAARMRFWMRLGYTAQGFHQSPLFSAEGPRHQSHGCYRLSRASARWLYDWADVGTHVHIVKRLSDSRFAWLLRERPGRPAAVRVASKPATSEQ